MTNQIKDEKEKNSGGGAVESSHPALVKIFALNDCEWWAGYDIESVKAAFLSQGYGDEGSFDDPRELTDLDMNQLTWVTDLASFPEGDVPITFRERLAQMVADGEAFPCFFASTEY